MTPDTFADLLERATAAGPPPPPPGAELAHGRRLLRRRRAVVLAAVLCATTVGSGVTAWAVRDNSKPIVAIDGSERTRGLAAACLEGRAYTSSGAATDASELFSGNAIDVRAVIDSGQQAVIAVDAGDDRHWAECVVHHDADERATMVVFDSTEEAPAPAYTVGPDCPAPNDADTCPSWHVYAAFRLPDDVSWARFTMADGQLVDVPSRNGYFVLNRVGPVPNGLTFQEWSAQPGFAAVTEVTYHEVSGELIAAGTGPTLTQRVAGLPPLSTYPLLGGPQEVFP